VESDYIDPDRYLLENGGTAGFLYAYGEHLTFNYQYSNPNYRFVCWRVTGPFADYITTNPTLHLSLEGYWGYLIPYTVEAQFEWYSTTAAIPDVNQESNVQIWGANGTVSVSSATPQDLKIYTLSGQLVSSKNQISNGAISLSKGVYIVKFGRQTKKVLL
jgi:hypothetical protein